jgi:hypothetical protein
MVVADAAKYGIPPNSPKTTYGLGTEYATALVIPSFTGKLCLSQDTWCFATPMPTYKGLAVHFDGVRGEVSTGNDFRPIRSGVANLFANVDSGLSDCLGGWFPGHKGCYSTMLLRNIREPENVRGLRVNGCEGCKVSVRCIYMTTKDCSSECWANLNVAEELHDGISANSAQHSPSSSVCEA